MTIQTLKEYVSAICGRNQIIEGLTYGNCHPAEVTTRLMQAIGDESNPDLSPIQLDPLPRLKAVGFGAQAEIAG